MGFSPKSMDAWESRSSAENQASENPLTGSKVLPRSNRLLSSVRKESTGTMATLKSRVSVRKASSSSSGCNSRPMLLSGLRQASNTSSNGAVRRRMRVPFLRMPKALLRREGRSENGYGMAVKDLPPRQGRSWTGYGVSTAVYSSTATSFPSRMVS